mmetsp:Transcript_157654/g.278257  ORF Transcript_157654/g.278257 Transcript_157654/m.278257 type:complete len:549 (+) Transcript_157654:84-1730(+)
MSGLILYCFILPLAVICARAPTNSDELATQDELAEIDEDGAEPVESHEVNLCLLQTGLRTTENLTLSRLHERGAANPLEVISDATKAVTDVVDAVSNATKKVADGVENATESISGNSMETINKVLVGMIVLVFTVAALAMLVEMCCPSLNTAQGRPSLLVCALLVVAYVLLLPGLFANLFSFNVLFVILGFDVPITEGDDGGPTVMESMWTFIRLLFETGCAPGAVLVIIYAVLVPVFKLVLLIVCETYRFSEVRDNRVAAQRSIVLVQAISKWACPDMFAYILLLYLNRTVGQGSGLVSAQGQLDIGFTCFSAFCLLSTILALAIPLPKTKDSMGTDDGASMTCLKFIFGSLGQHGKFLMMLLVYVCFAFEMSWGIFTPCMGLNMNSKSLLQPDGPIPVLLAPALAALNLEQEVRSEVSLWSCTETLIGWSFSKGDGNCFVATIMIAVFVILFTWVSMTLLLLASLQIYFSADPAKTISASRVLGHISMLDVCIMGVIVVTVVGAMYEDKGIVIYRMPGLWLLLKAELLHYLAYHCVAASLASSDHS